jgi:hypothetical protein
MNNFIYFFILKQLVKVELFELFLKFPTSKIGLLICVKYQCRVNSNPKPFFKKNLLLGPKIWALGFIIGIGLLGVPYLSSFTRE